MYTHTLTCTQTIHTQTHTCINVYTHHTHTHKVCTHMYTQTHALTHTHSHAHTHTPTHTHTHTSACTHPHTHTPTHTHALWTYSFQYLFFPELFENSKHNIKEWRLIDVMDSFEANWKCLLKTRQQKLLDTQPGIMQMRRQYCLNLNSTTARQNL